MKPTWRPHVSLVSEAGMFLWTPRPLFKCWSTLKFAIFGLSLSFLLPVGGEEGGGLV